MPPEVIPPEVEPEAPEEVETPEVEPVVKEKPVVEPPEEVETEKEKELKSKLAEARTDAEKKRRQKIEAQKSAGQWETLYTETLTESQAQAATIETLTAERDAAVKQAKQQAKELDSYRTSLIDRFESDDDKALAKDVPLGNIPALYERLYGKGLMTPPPSAGTKKTATRAAEDKPVSRRDELAKQYGVN